MRKFVLASQSPRRHELLRTLGIDFRIVIDNSPEMADLSKQPAEIVQELAQQKAKNVFTQCQNGEIILAADTVVVFNGNVLGKPSDKDSARNMLSTLSAHTHEVYTGICIIDTECGKECTDYECTQVTFKKLTDYEIENYIFTGEPMDKAGAYGIQGLGALFVEKISGDYFNVMGLPLCKLGKILNTAFAIPLL